MNHVIGLAIETTVAVLLAITIVYCCLLDRRLRRFRSDEQSMRTIIAELITATEIAERAIAGLKVTVRECDRDLGERLRSAERFSASIEQHISAGNTLMRRLSEVSGNKGPLTSRAPAAPAAAATSTASVTAASPAPNARSTLAAAQALVARARTRQGDLAA